MDGIPEYIQERIPYSYFTHLEKILNACDATYGGLYGEDKSHLDLTASLDVVQWTTNPLWSELPRRCSPDAQRGLLDDGVPFFRETLSRNARIGLLLGNGRSAVEQLERAFKVEFRRVARGGTRYASVLWESVGQAVHRLEHVSVKLATQRGATSTASQARR